MLFVVSHDRCQTGNCIYNTTAPKPPAPPIPHEHHHVFVRSCLA